MIKGQEKICTLIDNATLDSFPRTLMLVGQKGAGKHLLCDYIANKFNLISLDITDDISYELIEEINQRVEPYLYIIRANSLSVREENIILKFLEEPLKNSYIVLVCETEVGLLATILNRCQVWHLQNYNKETLRLFLNGASEELLSVAQTPGQIKELSAHSYVDMIALADKIIDKINIASVPNTLTLSSKLAFKNERDKFNPELFFSILKVRLSEKWANNANINYVQAYTLTSNLVINSKVKNVDVKALFEKYLIDLRAIMRGTLL